MGLVQIRTADPIVWKRTKHAIATKLQYSTMVLELKNPCPLAMVKKEYPDEYDLCLKTYKRKVKDVLERYCATTNKMELHLPKDYKEENSPRRKRFVIMAAIGIGVLVSSAVVGIATSIYMSNQAVQKAKETELKLIQSIEVIKTDLEINKEIQIKTLEALKQMAADYNDTMVRLTHETHFLRWLNALNSRLSSVELNLVEFLRGVDEGKIGPEFDFLFPRVAQQLCTNCPLGYWEFESCKLFANQTMDEDDTLILKIIAPIVDSSKEILEAKAFRIIKESNGQVCHYQYSGHPFVMWNNEKECTRDIIFTPQRKMEAFLMLDSDTCPIHSPHNQELWRKIRCTPVDQYDLTDPDSTQFQHDSKYNYFYCYNQTLTVSNVTIRCQNMVYRVPRNLEVKINNQTVTIRRVLQATIPLDHVMSEFVNAQIFTGIRNYTRVFRQVDQLIEEESKGIEKLSQPSFLITNEINLYVIGMAVVLIAIGVLIGWRYYYGLKIKLAQSKQTLSPVLRRRQSRVHFERTQPKETGPEDPVPEEEDEDKEGQRISIHFSPIDFASP